MTIQSKHLVQILLPMSTGKSERLDRRRFESLLHELTDRFGGATSFKQSPGQGSWDSGQAIENDSVALIEIMTGELDEKYWNSLKTRLEADLSQDVIVIRAHSISQF